MTRDIAIVGGGWAGLAAAVELAEAGWRVELFEAAKQLGGRARSVDWGGTAIDNGQHLMIGAYRETLRLMARLGTHPTIERRPHDLRVPGFRLALPRLPAPLHLAAGLLACQGLAWSEKFAAVRFMRGLEKAGFRLERDLGAAEFLALHRQPPRLVDRLWAPICVAALNTPLETASAQVFCNVLRDSLAGDRAASDLVMNRADLGRLLPEAAADFIQARGGAVHLSSTIERISRVGDGFRLHGPEIEVERLILAVHPARLPALVAGLLEMDDIAAQVAAYEWQPILTLWLQFESAPRFPFPMFGLGDGAAPWAFERDDLAPGMVAIVMSAEGPHMQMGHEALRDDYLAQLAQACGPLPPLRRWKIIAEKRATFACTPGMARPDSLTPLPGLYLAGDYVEREYPATLEGAVRSGVKCARTLLEQR